MTYFLVGERDFVISEREQLVATLINHGYMPLEENENNLGIYTHGESMITLGIQKVQLSFAYTNNHDKDHLLMLQSLEQITGIREVQVNNKTEERILKAAGINAILVKPEKKKRIEELV